MTLKTEDKQRNIDIYNEYLSIGVMRVVGDKYGLTRERVRQIVKRFGYKKPKKYVKPKEEREKEKRDKFIGHFWERTVVTDSGCWEWTGCRLPTGYGHIGFYQNRNCGTHRVAWILTHGDIPKGLCVCHKCDNPPCINPDHLFLGTRADNVHDRDAKGRTHKGKRVPKNQKLVVTKSK